MKNPERVTELLAELRELAENDFERHRLDVLERDLVAPPVVEVIDDTHQRFNGVVYRKTKTGHYSTHSLIHRDIWFYFCGELPVGHAYEIHHEDWNPDNNNISNLKLMTHAEHRMLHNGTPVIERKCPACGKIFRVKQTSKKKCCSIQCANAIKTHKQISYVEKTCAVCGKNFSVPYKSRKQKSCSKICANKLRSMSHQKPPAERICPVCGKTFTLRNPSDNHTCCSVSCAAKIRQRSPVEKICPVCGKKFLTTSSNHIYCSQSCGWKMRRRRKSSNSPQ